MSEQPYELPPGFRVNERGTLVDPACYRSNAVTKGMGIRRSAFIYTLDLDFPTRESVRMQCWSSVDGGEMGLYDEAAILRLIRTRLAEQCDRAQAQLAAIDEAIRTRG